MTTITATTVNSFSLSLSVSWSIRGGRRPERMEISITGNSRGLHRDALALDRRYHVETLSSTTLSFFLFYSTIYGTTRPRLSRMCPREITPCPPSISSGLTFRRFALSSVMFIVYGVDDEVADDEIYSDAPRSSGPAGRPSQSECLISYFWFSYFVAALFLLLLFLIFCPNRLSLPSRCPVPRSQPSNSIYITPSTVQARKLTYTYGSVLAADSRCILGEINEIRYRDRVRFRRNRTESFPIIRHLSRRFLDRIKIQNIVSRIESSQGELQSGRKNRL